jgi:hypothetical protein
MRHFVLVAFLLIDLSIHAQTDVATGIAIADSMFSPKLTGEFFVQETNYKGEIYFNDQWVKADIQLSTGETAHVNYLKYNGFLDEFIWVNESNFKQFKLDKRYICDVWMNNNLGSPVHFKRINVRDSASSQRPDIFVEVATEGTISLYIQRKVVHVEDEVVNTLARSYFVKVYVPNPLYYIQLPSHRCLKTNKLGRRHFLHFFPEQKTAISKIIRENHLDLKTESGWKEAIDWMNVNGLGF